MSPRYAIRLARLRDWIYEFERRVAVCIQLWIFVTFAVFAIKYYFEPVTWAMVAIVAGFNAVLNAILILAHHWLIRTELKRQRVEKALIASGDV